MEKDNMKRVYEIMPEGWKEAAKTEKALLRSRNIKTGEELLRLIFLYQTSGESYGLTVALTQISENQKGLNKTAVQKRIVNSGAWLQWLCKNLCHQEGFLVTPPQWLNEYRVCVVDDSDYSKQGTNKADFRLHYMMELFSFHISELYFTTAAEGETLTRYTQIRKKDLILADRGYGTKKGILHVLDHKADFLLRMRSNSFSLYTEDDEIYDLTKKLREDTPGKRIDLNLFIRNNKERILVRICAVAK